MARAYHRADPNWFARLILGQYPENDPSRGWRPKCKVKWGANSAVIDASGAWQSDCWKEYYERNDVARAASVLMADSDVVELGAGCGCVTGALLDLGLVKSISAFDGNSNIESLTNGLVRTMDLTKDMSETIPEHDWTLCTEVAEHIPHEFEPTFLNNLVAGVRKGVVLTWAGPDVSGHGHVNRQEPKYVNARLGERNFVRDEAKTKDFVERVKDYKHVVVYVRSEQ